MKVDIIPVEAPALKAEKSHFLDRFARRFLLGLLQKISFGQLTLVEKKQTYEFGRLSADPLPRAPVWIHHPRFYTRTLFGGTIGAAEAYMEGLWSSDDLTSVIRILVQNQRLFEEMEKGWAWLTAPFHKIHHFLRRNTPAGSRENIVAHYDLGNDFYELFLDETLTYSCGIFEHKESSLSEASLAKYRRICQKLELSPDDHVIEIGTGWGGFALFAARHYGCRVTTTTLSLEQYKRAGERINAAGLSDKITLLHKDYRDLTGRYDKLVSIEMIEAVGHHYFDTFFRVCSRLLREDGMMLLQAITIRDQVFEQHKRSVDFTRRYIFPGSCIPSIAAMTASIARVTDLKLFHLEDITPHYARTLSEWRKRFLSNIDKVRAMKFPEAFIRMWEYYLCYTEGGFAERYIGDVQILLTKPLCRRVPVLPPLSSEPGGHT